MSGADDLLRLLTGARIGQPTQLTVVTGGALRSRVVAPAERESPRPQG